jgi:septal ring factor EnvC (AmiA/AmiB activator)
MELSQIALAGLGLVCSVLGWFARELYSATQKLREDLSKLEAQIGRDYIRYDRLQDALKPIMESLSEIKHTLSQKADKP